MIPAEELVALLNTLLEAERAGAKVLAAYLDDYDRNSPEWARLAAVQRDEARNCGVLMAQIRRMSGTPSAATGDFLHKALVVKGKVARLQYLNRGQRWVTRRISEALPQVEQECVRRALVDMHASHIANIDACDALLRTLDE